MLKKRLKQALFKKLSGKAKKQLLKGSLTSCPGLTRTPPLAMSNLSQHPAFAQHGNTS